MTTTVKINTIWHCSLERAFKTPMLCDITKVHTGYGLSPKVLYCTGDEHWGKPGGSKKVVVASTLLHKGGEAFTDKVLERIDNKYWKIEVGNFNSWMFGFSKFVGEWETTELEPGKISITYTYTLHSEIVLLYPLNWLFAKTFWKIYMKRVLGNMRKMAMAQEPYLYE